MIGPEFATPILKIGRAKEHFELLKAELIAWNNTDPKPYIVSRKCDPEGKRHSLIVNITKPPPLDRWALLAGDCVHNLRSALDSSIYALAVKESGTNPPPDFDSLQFPITDTAVKFAGQAARRLSALSAQTRARVERAQPYNRWHAEFPPLLRLLSDFDNIDKHRLLNVVIANISEGKVSMGQRSILAFTPLQIPYNVGFHVGLIESGAEIMHFSLPTAQPDMDYKYDVTFVISISHPVGPSGRSFGELGYILEILIAEVERIVNDLGL